MKLYQKRTDLESFLKKAKVNWIVSIDDDNSTANKVEESEMLLSIACNPSKYYHILNQAGFDLSFFELLIEMDEPQRKDYLRKNLVETQNETWLAYIKNNTSNSDSPFISILCKLKDDQIISDYTLLSSVSEAKSNFDTIVADVNPSHDKRILWLIDRDFTYVGEGPDSGFDIISLIAEKESEVHICVLLTANIEDIAPQDVRNRFLKEKDLLKFNLLVTLISKDEFVEFGYGNGKQQVVNKILVGLWGNYNYLVINRLVKNLEESVNLAGNELLSLSAGTLRHILLKFPEKEGVSSPDTIFRILSSLVSKNFNNTFVNNSLIYQMLRDYKDLEYDVDLSIDDKKTIFDLINSEKYEVVNELQKQIGFGDIFLLKDQYYILLSQPCDIAYRKGRKLKRGLLVKLREPLKEERDENDDNLKGKSRAPIYISDCLKYFIYQKRYILDYRDFIMLDFDVLDLCVLNKSGEAKINLDLLQDRNAINYELLPYDEQRVNDLLKAVTFKHEIYGILYNLKRSYNDVISSLFANTDKHTQCDELTGQHLRSLSIINSKFKHLLDNSDFWCLLSCPEQINNDLNYNIKRVCRLKEPFSLKIYAGFSNYHARIGLPGDYAEELLVGDGTLQKEVACAADSHHIVKE